MPIWWVSQSTQSALKRRKQKNPCTCYDQMFPTNPGILSSTTWKKKVFLMKILLSFYSSKLAHIGKSILSNIAILNIYHRFTPDRIKKKKELCSISIKNAKDYEWEWVKVAQSCLTLCDPMDCNPPGSPLSMGFFRQEYYKYFWICLLRKAKINK